MKWHWLSFCRAIYKCSKEYGRIIHKHSKYHLLCMFFTAIINCAAVLWCDVPWFDVTDRKKCFQSFLIFWIQLGTYNIIIKSANILQPAPKTNTFLKNARSSPTNIHSHIQVKVNLVSFWSWLKLHYKYYSVFFWEKNLGTSDIGKLVTGNTASFFRLSYPWLVCIVREFCNKLL